VRFRYAFGPGPNAYRNSPNALNGERAHEQFNIWQQTKGEMI